MRNRDIRNLRKYKRTPWTHQAAEELGYEAEDESDADDDLDAAWFDQQWEMPQNLMRNFPSDRDMREAGWTTAEIERACQAHENAHVVLSNITKA